MAFEVIADMVDWLWPIYDHCPLPVQ